MRIYLARPAFGNSVFVPVLIMIINNGIMTESVRSRAKAAEKKLLEI